MNIHWIDHKSAFPLRLETARLTLRAPMRADVPAIAQLANNNKIFEVLARLPHPYTRADAVGFVEIVAQRPDERIYSILTKAGSFMGAVGLHFETGQPPELGYWLGEPYWGKGYMTEAAGALIEAARATGQITRIKARALASNESSLRVLEKTGFLRMGERLDAIGNHKGRWVVDYLLDVSP